VARQAVARASELGVAVIDDELLAGSVCRSIVGQPPGDAAEVVDAAPAPRRDARSTASANFKKDMIKTGGENVASRELEEAIYRLPQVSEVAVVGIDHPRWVEAVVAVIVVKAGQTLTEGQVLAHCNAQMAGFKAPKGVVFVDALPKNPSGKLLKRQLRQAHAQLFGSA